LVGSHRGSLADFFLAAPALPATVALRIYDALSTNKRVTSSEVLVFKA